MNILAWNVQGLGNDWTFQILHGYVQQYTQYLMNNFREAINYCGLADLGFRGPKFTWNRGNGAYLVQERLDRMLGNCGWLDLFPNSLVHQLNLRGSDHRPLLVELLRADERAIIGKNWKRGRFHFEEAYKEERYWRQRSKDSWLKCGDRNSKFFHRKASARKIKNSITGLVDINGNWCEEDEGIANIIENYFDSLFSSSYPSSVDFDRVLEGIERKVTPQQNEQMDQAFVAEDVRTAVFQMAPTKSPGADGMSAIFYQKFWPIIGEDITAACLSFVNGGLSLGSINETIITLLPKVKNPTRITEFRPISLCNVIYKIISKMLANRLRRVMGSVISEEQSAFIPGRLITDNAIIGFESLHAIKRRKTKKNYLALKLDMAKAYDRVEWEFIQRMMTKLGFSGVWINKIMACISSVTYSFQFNGKRFGHLTPSRGLRQGDPLSPYLFLLCGEGLSSLLHRYEQNEVLQGLRCGMRGPTISHLLFADDSLFFLEAKLSACAAVKEILRFYEAASGQMGLFSSIRDRVWNKLCGWKSKLLSAGGREVLSKAIIQAIPTYAMNLFKLPSSLIKELHRLSAQFWWGGEHGKRKMHWCTWEKLCCHKADGGMGFRDLSLFNKAILAKQAWRIHSQPTSLVARVLQGFYFHRSSFLQVKVNSSSSFIWRSILWGRELYKQGLRRKIGSGQDTYIYHDCWLPRAGVFKISSPRVLGKFDKVSSLITASGSWDSSLIWESFHEDEAEAILSLPLPKRTTPDTLRWHYDKSGHYTVRNDDSCYSWARLHHADFLEANCRKGDPSKKVVASPWQAPIVGFVKVNTDAAWCGNQKKFGLGSVIRDHTGKVLGSVAIPVASSVSVAVAESWALEKGASLAKQMGFSAVILESDCLGVTKALESRTLIDSDLSYVFDSIYEICNEFDMYKFSYTPRIGNQVAHSLARLALSLENDQYWPSGIPESLIPLVSSDSQHVPSS
ncbi:hypothetical protein UlMin_028862 [Ulmus minor]